MTEEQQREHAALVRRTIEKAEKFGKAISKARDELQMNPAEFVLALIVAYDAAHDTWGKQFVNDVRMAFGDEVAQ